MKKHPVYALVVLGMVSSPAFAAVSYRYFRIPERFLDAKSVAATGFVRDHVHDDTFAFGYVPRNIVLPDTWNQALTEVDARAVAHRGIDPKSLRFLESAESDGAREDFHTYDTLTSELKSIAAKAPAIVRLESAGKTVQNREMWLVRLGSSKGRNSQLKLLYVSSMHGDEVTGKELLVYLIRDLVAGYGKDARATALLDNAEIFLMPSMNPDGTELEQRFNADGVDLNRDFPEDGDADESGRAVETVALMHLFQANHFLLAANFHGGSLVVNLPWDHRPNPPGASTNFGDDALILDIGKEYAKANRPMYANSSGSFNHGVTYGYEWYQVLGGMQDWSILAAQSTHTTIELSNTKWPSASSLPGFWRDNRESLYRFLERGMEGVHLKVVDSRGAPVPVTVEVSSAKRPITYPNGVVHRPTIAGKQRVKLSAQGFRGTQVDVERTRFDGKYQTVVLDR